MNYWRVSINTQAWRIPASKPHTAVALIVRRYLAESSAGRTWHEGLERCYSVVVKRITPAEYHAAAQTKQEAKP